MPRPFRATVAEIHRYPVKSMRGERLDEIAIGRDGLRGDRAWAARDDRRGSIEGARKLPALLDCAARFTEPVDGAGDLPVPEIELPDGRRLRADDPLSAEALSKLIGRTVSLWPRRPAEDTAHYRRGQIEQPNMLEELRAIFARLPDEPLPDLGLFPREVLTSATLPGTYFDAYPLFLLTRASLERLASAAPESRFDPRRFRPNLLLDHSFSEDETQADAQDGARGEQPARTPDADGSDDEGFPENAWVGHRLRIGEAVIAVAMACPRCLITTLPFADLPKDPTIMRTLVRENGGNVGVYASVEQPGVVREGDAVELLD